MHSNNESAAVLLEVSLQRIKLNKTELIWISKTHEHKWWPVYIVRFTELDTVALNQVSFLQFFNAYIHLRIYISLNEWRYYIIHYMGKNIRPPRCSTTNSKQYNCKVEALGTTATQWWSGRSHKCTVCNGVLMSIVVNINYRTSNLLLH